MKPSSKNILWILVTSCMISLGITAIWLTYTRAVHWAVALVPFIILTIIGFIFLYISFTEK